MKWERFTATAAICAALVIGALLPTLFEQSRAQYADQTTWVPSSGVTGSGNAVVLALPNVVNLNQLLGVPVRFIPGANAAAGGATVQINSLTAKSALRVSAGSLVPLADHDFSTAALAEVVWDGTEFVHKNPATGTAPVGSEIAVTNTAPAGYLLENGACVSQSTYSALYAYYGSTDLWLTQAGGSACSAGQFHVPFANGRTSVASDTMGGVAASVLTSAGSGCGATTVAVGCGSQNRSLSSTNQLPQFTPSGSIGGTFTSPNLIQQLGGSFTAGSGSGWSLTALIVTGSSFSFTGNAIGSGSPTPFTTVQPTYTVFKAVKY